MERKITLAGTEYVMRYSLRMFFVYERIAGKSYDGGSLFNLYLQSYSCLLGSNPDTFTLDFEKFIDECDKDAAIMGAFSGLLEDYARIHSSGDTACKKKAESR